MAGTPSGDAYEVGENVGLAVTFGPAEAPIDPAVVTVRLMDPTGRRRELTFGVDEALVRTAPGSYQLVVVATVAGRWRYRFVGSGQRRGAFDGYFDVFDLSPGP